MYQSPMSRKQDWTKPFLKTKCDLEKQYSVKVCKQTVFTLPEQGTMRKNNDLESCNSDYLPINICVYNLLNLKNTE